MFLFWILVLGFANWRTASILAYEDGPFNVFEKLRHVRVKVLRDLFGCFWCVSVWSGIVFALVAFVSFDIQIIMILPLALALSTFAIMLQTGLLAISSE
jgi:hypothetical protein